MIEDAVQYILSTNAALAALVGARIYYFKALQTVTMPYVVIYKVSGVPYQSHSGSTLTKSRIQATCVSDNYNEASGVSSAVKTALQGYQGTVEGVRIDSCLLDNDYDASDTLNYRTDIQQEKYVQKILDFILIHGG